MHFYVSRLDIAQVFANNVIADQSAPCWTIYHEPQVGSNISWSGVVHKKWSSRSKSDNYLIILGNKDLIPMRSHDIKVWPLRELNIEKYLQLKCFNVVSHGKQHLKSQDTKLPIFTQLSNWFAFLILFKARQGWAMLQKPWLVAGGTNASQHLKRFNKVQAKGRCIASGSRIWWGECKSGSPCCHDGCLELSC